MPERNVIKSGGRLLSALLDDAVCNRPVNLPGGAELGLYAKAFNDGDLVKTCLSLFDNDLNVSRTAAQLYMHRNTLIYRINKLKRLTGLDVCKFDDAVTFIILYRAFRGRQ